MKLGFCSLSALDRPLGAVADVAAACGLDGLEVCGRPPHLDPDAGVAAGREAGRAVRRAGLEVMAYGSYLGRAGASDAGMTRRAVAMTEALETPLLRVWAEPLPDVAGGEDFERVVELLRGACAASSPLGITVVVERHRGSYADTPERALALLDAVDRDNIALNYQVLDFLPPETVDAQPADAARLAPRARYFHLKNYQPNPQGTGPLVPGASLEHGALDYRAILGAAQGAGYAGPLAIEFLSFEPKPLEEKLASDAAFVRRVLAELAA